MAKAKSAGETEQKAVSPNDEALGEDPLALSVVFADPQGLLETKYRSLAEVKDDCLVVLDANVLLMPYLIEKVSLSEAVAVYKKLADAKRLIVPAQAAREFGKHRSRKLADIVRHLQDQASKLVAPLSKQIGFLADDPDYVEMRKLADKIGSLGKELQKRVQVIVSRISSEIGNDPVSNSYRDVLKGCVRDADEPANRKAFEKELKERFAVKRPPGYKDSQKADAGAGDLLIWQTILRAGKTEAKDVIFVTADEKADWYLQSGGAFQPRLELIEEFRAETGGKTLHILPLSRLLELFGAEEKAIAEVRQAEAFERSRRPDSQPSELSPVDAAGEWHAANFELQSVEKKIEHLQKMLSDFGIDHNTSLSLPWNRAAHSTRIELHGLVSKREELNRRMRELERSGEF